MQIVLTLYILIGIMLTAFVLMQNQSGGLGATWGGSGSYHTRRGIEKALFSGTIILSILFTVLSIVVLI